MSEKLFLIRKGGYYYRPNAQGYTAHKLDAGRYSEAEAIAYRDACDPGTLTIEPAPESEASENRRQMQARFAQIRLSAVFRAARQMAKRSERNRPNWSFAMDLFGLGSTYAWHLVKSFDMDPDATTTERNGGAE